MDPYTSVGFVGVGAIVAAYFANQQGWLNAEVIWAAISVYGLIRRMR